MIEIFATIVASFFAAYLGAFYGFKNIKKEKFFEERKKIYSELVSVLPIIDRFWTQSDYLDGNEGSGNAESRIPYMQVQLKIAEEELEKRKKNKESFDRQYEVENEISNWKYKIKKHEEYLNEMKELHNKFDIFDNSGNRNLLRIFASVEVWNSYMGLFVALNNEYHCNNGVKTEDIVYHINNIINYIRRDLQA